MTRDSVTQDIDSGNTYYHNLLDGVKAGYCSMKDAMCFQLGLFFFVSLLIRIELFKI